MIKSSKHQKTIPITLAVTGGINLQSSPMSIADDEAELMQNWCYEKGATSPSIRPAVTCETSTACSDEIILLYHYTKDSSNSWLMGVSDAFDVYYYNTSTNVWTDTTINVAKKPSMLTYNGKLLMADGATTLKTWDGTTSGTVSIDGSLSPDILAEVGNRVVINDTQTTGRDFVGFSPVEWDVSTAWQLDHTDGSVGLRVGYKDGSNVVGLVKNFKNELIVLKQGDRSETIYRVQTVGVPYDASNALTWISEFVMAGQGASNSHCVESVDTAVLFLGRYGLGALVADEMYSELNLQAIGKKINPVLGAVGNTNYELRYLATTGQVWILRNSDTIYIYHPHNGAFTTYEFNNEQIYSVTENSSGVYFAGESGHLYKLDVTETQDEFTPSTNTDLTGILKLKDLDMGPGRGLVKASEFLFKPITGSTTNIYYADNSKNGQVKVDEHTVIDDAMSDFMLADTDFMSGSDYDFMGLDGLPWSQEIKKKWKGKRIQFQVTTVGRCQFDGVTAQIAAVGG